MTPLSVKQLAANWGVSKSIVYALVRSGELPSFRIGLGRGTIRILASDAEKYKALKSREDETVYAEHFA